jgi:hypothetical protein
MLIHNIKKKIVSINVNRFLRIVVFLMATVTIKKLTEVNYVKTINDCRKDTSSFA